MRYFQRLFGQSSRKTSRKAHARRHLRPAHKRRIATFETLEERTVLTVDVAFVLGQPVALPSWLSPQ